MKTHLVTLILLGAVARLAVAHEPLSVATGHLPNAIQIHARAITGGTPLGEKGFEELKRLGVRTVISVDGAAPDLVAAKQMRLRYVHLPHGYEGMSAERLLDLAKGVRDLPGTIYIHCHHGKHRSPAAGAAACVVAGMITADDARSVLQLAGTSKQYVHLFRMVETAKQCDASTLDRHHAVFPEYSEPPPLAKAMAALEQSYDRLLHAVGNEKHARISESDSKPGNEALLLSEHFTELLRLDVVAREPAAFKKKLSESKSAADQIARLLVDGLPAGTTSMAEVKQLLSRVSSNCQSCHAKFRDAMQYKD